MIQPKQFSQPIVWLLIICSIIGIIVSALWSAKQTPVTVPPKETELIDNKITGSEVEVSGSVGMRRNQIHNSTVNVNKPK